MRIFQLLWAILLPAAAIAVQAQTQVDLRTQSRNVDFSSASATKPVRTGTTLPATCAVGEMFFKLDAIPGQNLQMCTSTNSWTTIVRSGGTGGGGGAATATAQLLDFQVARLNSVTLTVGMDCNTTLPCVVRFGNRSVSIVNGAMVTLSGTGTGVAFLYITPQGNIVVGHNLTVSCTSGCTEQSGVSSFPADAIPIATWTATNGAWDTSGGTDFRGYLSTKNVLASTGLLGTEVNGLMTLSVDGTMVGFRVGVPATATTACSQGSWSADSSFYYICVATNTWRRASTETW